MVWGVAAITVGILYVGYIVITDPTVISPFTHATHGASVPPAPPVPPVNPADSPGNIPDIRVEDVRTEGGQSLIPLLFSKTYGLAKEVVSLPRKSIKSI